MSATYTILGDWGTSRLRLFRLVDGAVVDRASGDGIGALHDTPAATLRNAIAPWLRLAGAPAHVVLCGMAGARTGLAEAPYADCPADADAWRARVARTAVEGLPIAIAAGLACTRDGAPDVMRGEETQVFGAQSLAPHLANGRHRVALPGTHSKWAWLEDGRIVAFRTVPTGELFALLRAHSTLTRAGPAPGHEAKRKDDAHDEQAGFDAGLARAREGRGVLGQLFEARAAQLRAGRTPGWALGFLSGLLIGHEVREALADDTGKARITLIGDPALTDRYARALAAFGAPSDPLDGDACALSGLQLLEDGIAWT